MFSENLKKYRKLKGLSQEELALQINVVRQTVSKWEKGISLTDAELLTKIARTLEISVSELLGIKIDVTDGKNELDLLTDEISKLNKYIEEYKKKLSNFKRKIIITIGIIIILIFTVAIYSSWTDLWENFGRNLYHSLND